MGHSATSLLIEEANRLAQRGDLAVVLQVIVSERPAPAVFVPLFANLITADVEIPDFGRDAFKVLPRSADLEVGMCRAQARRYICRQDGGVTVDVHAARFEWLARAGLWFSRSEIQSLSFKPLRGSVLVGFPQNTRNKFRKGQISSGFGI